MHKKTLSDITCKGNRVLMRVDFNVPLDDQGNITSDKRIVEALPSIRKITESGGRLILMSHLGRPKGKVVPELSLLPVAKRLSELLDAKVVMAEDCIGTGVMQQVLSLQDGDIMLLENLRFHPEEEKNDPEFARELASLGEIYVNDAFGTAHRAHASTEGICHFVQPSVAGFLMEKELKYLGQALQHPERPFLAILGGAKISGKIDVLENLFGKVDAVLVGGAMIFTFFRAMGYETGTSLVEEDKVELASKLLETARKNNIRMLLPEDVVVAPELSATAETRTVAVTDIPGDVMGLDIGPKTIDSYSREILQAKTIVWNGPMGAFEVEPFAEGTIAVARTLADATAKGSISIVGGGDSAAAVTKAGLAEGITHISTGGGASLEFLEGKDLPGISALND